MLFQIKQRKQESNKIKKKCGLKRERAERYSTQKTNKKNVDPSKAVEGYPAIIM